MTTRFGGPQPLDVTIGALPEECRDQWTEQPEDHRGHARPASAFLFAVPALCTLATCGYGIADRQVWRDEHATWWASSLSIHDLSMLIRNMDIVLLPYYLFMHVWIDLFGDSAAALRAPSAMTMALAAGLLALLGRQLFTPRTGLLAGLIFAVVPNVVHYGQEARPYAFAVLAAVASTLLLVRALERPSVKAWAGYTASIPFLGWTHLVAITVLGGHLTAVLIVSRTADRIGRRIASWAFAAAAITGASLVAPMALQGSRESGQIAWNKATIADLLAYPSALFGSWHVAIPIMVMSLLGIFAARSQGALLVAWAILPPSITFVTANQLHLFLARYLLFTAPAWILLAAAAVTRLGGPLTGHARGSVPLRVLGYVLVAGAVAAVGQVAIPGLKAARTDLADQPDFRRAAQLIMFRQRAGDGIVYDSSAKVNQVVERMSMAYYLRADTPPPTDVLLTRTPRQLGLYTAQECTDPNRCAANVRRLWLLTVATGDMFSGLTAGTANVLRHQFKTAGTYPFPNLRVFLLERTRSAEKPKHSGAESLSGHKV